MRPENGILPLDDPNVAACISDWMKDHHLQLNLAKTELLVISTNPTLLHSARCGTLTVINHAAYKTLAFSPLRREQLGLVSAGLAVWWTC
ncbi:hypothetical protein PO909_005821 [Leuciscus waleckii]